MKWLLTRFYGHPKASKRYLSCDLLSRINPKEIPSCAVGDFNEILRQQEN